MSDTTGFHARNYLAGVFNNYLADESPRRFRRRCGRQTGHNYRRAPGSVALYICARCGQKGYLQ